jgi:hypothetical protein
MKPKHPPKPRSAKRPAAPAAETPAEAAVGAKDPAERQWPAPDELQGAGERAEESIEAVAQDGAEGGVYATLD